MKKFKLSQWFYLLCFIVIILGIFFRWTNLDTKVYWHDEVFTSLHITGFTWGEWNPQLFTGEIINRDHLQHYLQVNPNKTLLDTLNVLAVDDPHHPPFYYILVKYWRQFFGDSITVIRSFSAFTSLLVFPSIYWLCWELFKKKSVGLFTICLVAISPLHVFYAQEAREYALWTVLICLSSAAFLRGVKLTKSLSKYCDKVYFIWGLYSFFITLSLYTSLFSLFFIISHVFYTILLEKLRFTKFLICQGISLIISICLFLPWIIVFINNYERYKQLTSWTTSFKLPMLDLLKVWGLNLSRIFCDVGWEFETLFSYLVIVICLILVSYSLYFLIKNTPINCWLFIVCIMISPIVFLLGPDLIFGGVRSLSPRYLIPFYLVTHIMVAYLLVSQLNFSRILNVRIWSMITAIILSMGILSCIINWSKDTVWTKVISYNLPEVARIVNQADSSLLISNNSSYNAGNIFALSYLLNSRVKLQLFSSSDNYQFSREFKNIFVLSHSDQLIKTLEHTEGVKTNQVFSDDHFGLWKISFEN